MPPKTFKEAKGSLDRAVEKRRLASIPDQEHIVPALTQSLLAPTNRQASRNLSRISQNLRYRNSNASFSSPSTTGSRKSLEFLQNKQEILRAQSREWLNVGEGLLEAFKCLSINEQTFKEEQENVKKHSFRIISEEIAVSRNMATFQHKLEARDEPDWPVAYMELMARIFRDDLQSKCHPDDRRSNKENSPWKQAVKAFHKSINPKNPKQVWCPVMRQFYYSEHFIKTAHIVPH
jgi:hypothetical protein